MLTRVREGLWVCTRALGDFTVNAALVLADRYALVVDSLLGTADMAPFLELIQGHGRPVLVINTHADWDHVMGNAAFPHVPIIGHRLCRERILSEGQEQVAAAQTEFSGLALSDPLVAPGIVFEGSLTVHAGGLTVCCHHLPGHTADSVVIRIPEWGVCLAGDTVEDPIPTIDPSGSVFQLREGLNRLRKWSDKLVIPGHGPVSGPELVKANLAYLELVLSVPDAGVPCPYLSENVPPFYQAAHAANVAAVLRERDV